jgi:hypothetical protein
VLETDLSTKQPTALSGNPWAIVGAVLYLLEWVAIVAAAPPGPIGPGTAANKLASDYASHAGGAAVAAAWFAVVLVGRVLFVAAVKASLRSRPRERPLLDLALGAMAISVVLEVATYAVVAATARLAADGASRDLLVGLDGAAFWLNLFLWGPVGVSVLACGLAMLRSRLYPAWLSWLGVVAGAAGIIACMIAGATTDSSGAGAADAVTSVPAIGMWVWMIATGVVLLRTPPGSADATRGN